MADLRRTEKECERTSRLQDFANVDIPTETGAVCDSVIKESLITDVSVEFRREAKILDLDGVGVVTETRNLVSVTTCRNIRQVRLEVNREVSTKFRGDVKILDLRADSVIKESFITAVDCEIPQSTFSPGLSNIGETGDCPLSVF